MESKIPIGNILFLDIETVPAKKSYEELDPDWQDLFEVKVRFQLKEDETVAEKYQQRAGILAEFNKIVCISVAFCRKVEDQEEIRVKSFAGHDEKALLSDFSELINNYFSKDYHYLCGHNGKEFDFPVIARRMLINGVPLPKPLNNAGKKPWEVKHLDTMELWKFGDYKNFTSLKLLAALFGIPSPKDDIDGSDVARVYYEENDLERIVKYCEKDTFTLCQVYRAMHLMPLLTEKQIKKA